MTQIHSHPAPACRIPRPAPHSVIGALIGWVAANEQAFRRAQARVDAASLRV